MKAKGLRLLKFEMEVENVPYKPIALTEDTVEDKDAMRKMIFNEVIKAKGNRENIMVNGISDMGQLVFISDRVMNVLRKYFAEEAKAEAKPGKEEKSEKKRPDLAKVKK